MKEHQKFSGKVSASILISAPPDKVFDYLDDPEKVEEWDPGFKGFSEVKGKGLGSTMRFKIEIAGKTMEGNQVFTDYVPGKKTVVSNSFNDENLSTLTTIFQPHQQGTKLTRIMEYSAEAPAISDLDNDSAQKVARDGMQKAIINALQEHIDRGNENIKAEMEK